MDDTRPQRQDSARTTHPWRDASTAQVSAVDGREHVGYVPASPTSSFSLWSPWVSGLNPAATISEERARRRLPVGAVLGAAGALVVGLLGGFSIGSATASAPEVTTGTGAVQGSTGMVVPKAPGTTSQDTTGTPLDGFTGGPSLGAPGGSWGGSSSGTLPDAAVPGTIVPDMTAPGAAAPEGGTESTTDSITTRTA